jgi:hypothetical protein
VSQQVLHEVAEELWDWEAPPPPAAKRRKTQKSSASRDKELLTAAAGVALAEDAAAAAAADGVSVLHASGLNTGRAGGGSRSSSSWQQQEQKQQRVPLWLRGLGESQGGIAGHAGCEGDGLLELYDEPTGLCLHVSNEAGAGTGSEGGSVYGPVVEIGF